MSLLDILLGAAILTPAVVMLTAYLRKRKHERLARRNFILNYAFPSALRWKLRQALPSLETAAIEAILAGLRQWFLLIHEYPGQRFAMPSKAVDTAWHEFILLTRDYHAFCMQAFGEYLHHTPFAGEGASELELNALARTHAYAPLVAAISGGLLAQGLPGHGTGLFDLDRELGIEGARLFDAATLDEFKRRHATGSGCSGSIGTEANGGSDADGSGCGGGGCGS